MANIHAVLNQRINKKSEHSSKMTAMAMQSANGNLTSFTGVFSIMELSDNEKLLIENILKNYADDNKDIGKDLDTLLSITSEVKAINNQAALLHGERIKKAHGILIKYADGAFTAWLMAAYGNRQTPYNLMQYYEFYESLPKNLRPKIESMPRQAIYTLASRTGSLEKKQEIVQNYQGETKNEIIKLIRQLFPLDERDKRKQKVADGIIQLLERLTEQLKNLPSQVTVSQKRKIKDMIWNLHQLME